jgi:hypothetical protein
MMETLAHRIGAGDAEDAIARRKPTTSFTTAIRASQYAALAFGGGCREAGLRPAHRINPQRA